MFLGLLPLCQEHRVEKSRLDVREGVRLEHDPNPNPNRHPNLNPYHAGFSWLKKSPVVPKESTTNKAIGRIRTREKEVGRGNMLTPATHGQRFSR